jgi:RNA polymerase sigma-70 factor (ECF subfamily)
MAIMALAFRRGPLELHAFDAAYLERLRTGDAETEGHFVRYFGELLLIKLRSRLRSRQAVEDVRQETFLRVLRTLRSEGIRDADRFGSFVNSVCNNVLLEAYRSQERHAPVSGEQTNVAEADSPGPEDQFITGERQAHVRRIVDDLPARDRRLLRAVFLEEREKDEVCAQLGVGRDYLRVLLHRAKLQFRALYLKRQTTRVAAFDRNRKSARISE